MRANFKDATLAELVHFAHAYLAETAQFLERAQSDEYGRIRDPETRQELKALRAWLARAEELAVTPVSLAPTPSWQPDPRAPRPDPREPVPDPRKVRPAPPTKPQPK